MGSDEAEATAAVFGSKVALEVARGFLLFTALRLIGPNTGKADRQAPEHAQDRHGFGRAHAAAILVQGNIQSLVPGFDSPVFTSTPQQFLRVALLGLSAGDYGPGFAARFVFLYGRRLEFTDLSGGHKTSLFRGGALHPQLAAFLPAAVVLPALGAHVQFLVRRGKRHQPRAADAPFHASLPGWFLS
jgi:hypothetical protein